MSSSGWLLQLQMKPHLSWTFLFAFACPAAALPEVADYNVLDYGAAGNGIAKDTAAIALGRSPPPMPRRRRDGSFSRGRYLSGSIQLESNIDPPDSTPGRSSSTAAIRRIPRSFPRGGRTPTSGSTRRSSTRTESRTSRSSARGTLDGQGRNWWWRARGARGRPRCGAGASAPGGWPPGGLETDPGEDREGLERVTSARPLSSSGRARPTLRLHKRARRGRHHHRVADVECSTRSTPTTSRSAA